MELTNYTPLSRPIPSSFRVSILLFTLISVSPCAMRAQGNDRLPDSLQSLLLKKYDGDTRYFSATADLNGDGQPETIVYIVSPSWCGSGGCPTLVFTPQSSGYRLVSTITVTRPPIRLSPRSAGGWRNLIVGVSGGGASAGSAELEFNGKSYPSNPTVPPARRTTNLEGATALIRDYDSFDSAKPLTAAKAGGAKPAEAKARESNAKPSFDCTNVGSAAERIICNDAGLAALDRKLSEVYQKAMTLWEPDVAAKERLTQRNWITARNRCGTTSDARKCLQASYERRIAELQIQSGQFMSPTPVGYICKGRENSRFLVAFYNDTDPRSAVITFDDKQVIALGERAASGAKYVAPNVEFWEHHGEATVKWAAATFQCKTR